MINTLEARPIDGAGAGLSPRSTLAIIASGATGSALIARGLFMVARVSFPAAFGMPVLGDVSDTFPVTSGRTTGQVYLDIVGWLLVASVGAALVALTVRAATGSAGARRAELGVLCGLILAALYVAITASPSRRCSFHSYDAAFTSCMSRGAAGIRDFVILAALPTCALILNLRADRPRVQPAPRDDRPRRRGR